MNFLDIKSELNEIKKTFSGLLEMMEKFSNFSETTDKSSFNNFYYNELNLEEKLQKILNSTQNLNKDEKNLIDKELADFQNLVKINRDKALVIIKKIKEEQLYKNNYMKAFDAYSKNL